MAQGIELVVDQWLSNIFQHDVLRLSLSYPTQVNYSDLIREIGGSLEKRPSFVYAKIPVYALDCIHALKDIGFRIVDRNMVFGKPIEKGRAPSGNTAVRFARSEDVKAIRNIAQESFKYSRFHLDPEIPNALANRIKGEWASNFFSGGRGNAMLIAEADGRVIGFLLLIYNGEVVVIDLIAVSEEFRRQNVAHDMIAGAENDLKGFKSIRVGTQLANVPSIQLYETLGFQVIDTQYIFHYHNT